MRIEETELEGKPVRIFLAEDNPLDAQIIGGILMERCSRCELTVCNDGQRALEMLRQVENDAERLSFDLVLLDLNIPKRTGFEILEWIRQAGRFVNVPVLIVTSSLSPDDFAQAQELGADEFFHKPMILDEYAELGDVVERALGKRSSRA